MTGPITSSGNVPIDPNIQEREVKISASPTLNSAIELGEGTDIAGGIQAKMKALTGKDLKDLNIRPEWSFQKPNENQVEQGIGVFSNPPGPNCYANTAYFPITYDDQGVQKTIIFSQKLYSDIEVPRSTKMQEHLQQQYLAGIAFSTFCDVTMHMLLKEAGQEGKLDRKLDNQISKIRADGFLMMKLSHGKEPIDLTPGKGMKFQDVTHIRLYFRPGNQDLKKDKAEAKNEEFIDINLNQLFKTINKTDEVGNKTFETIRRSHELRGIKYILAKDENMPGYLREIANAQRVNIVLDEWESAGKRKEDFPKLLQKQEINEKILAEVTQGEAEVLGNRFNHLLYLSNDQEAIHPLLHEFGTLSKEGKGVNVRPETVQFLIPPKEPKEPTFKEKLHEYMPFIGSKKKDEVEPNPELSNLTELAAHLAKNDVLENMTKDQYTEFSYIRDAYKKVLKEMTTVSDDLILKETVLAQLSDDAKGTEDQRKDLIVKASNLLAQIDTSLANVAPTLGQVPAPQQPVVAPTSGPVHEPQPRPVHTTFAELHASYKTGDLNPFIPNPEDRFKPLAVKPSQLNEQEQRLLKTVNYRIMSATDNVSNFMISKDLSKSFLKPYLSQNTNTDFIDIWDNSFGNTENFMTTLETKLQSINDTKNIPLRFQLGAGHFVVAYIDPTKRSLEYFERISTTDGVRTLTYDDQHRTNAESALNRIKDMLTQKFPGEPFTVVKKLDTYAVDTELDPMTLHFIMNKDINPEVNFNPWNNSNQKQETLANLRVHAMRVALKQELDRSEQNVQI